MLWLPQAHPKAELKGAAEGWDSVRPVRAPVAAAAGIVVAAAVALVATPTPTPSVIAVPSLLAPASPGTSAAPTSAAVAPTSTSIPPTPPAVAPTAPVASVPTAAATALPGATRPACPEAGSRPVLQMWLGDQEPSGAGSVRGCTSTAMSSVSPKMWLATTARTCRKCCTASLA